MATLEIVGTMSSTTSVTGVTVATELVDLFEFSDGRIQTYSEFFVPR